MPYQRRQREDRKVPFTGTVLSLYQPPPDPAFLVSVRHKEYGVDFTIPAWLSVENFYASQQFQTSDYIGRTVELLQSDSAHPVLITRILAPDSDAKEPARIQIDDNVTEISSGEISLRRGSDGTIQLSGSDADMHFVAPGSTEQIRVRADAEGVQIDSKSATMYTQRTSDPRHTSGTVTRAQIGTFIIGRRGAPRTATKYRFLVLDTSIDEFPARLPVRDQDGNLTGHYIDLEGLNLRPELSEALLLDATGTVKGWGVHSAATWFAEVPRPNLTALSPLTMQYVFPIPAVSAAGDSQSLWTASGYIAIATANNLSVANPFGAGVQINYDYTRPVFLNLLATSRRTDVNYSFPYGSWFRSAAGVNINTAGSGILDIINSGGVIGDDLYLNTDANVMRHEHIITSRASNNQSTALTINGDNITNNFIIQQNNAPIARPTTAAGWAAIVDSVDIVYWFTQLTHTVQGYQSAPSEPYVQVVIRLKSGYVWRDTTGA